MNSRTAIDAITWLIEEAFEGDSDHSLLAILRDLREQDCLAHPSEAGRSIAEVLEYVGWSKGMYEDYQDRLTNWGDILPTRKMLRIMIAHDFYHAGEINHIRALLQGTDRWPY